jgi:hypothetical protein
LEHICEKFPQWRPEIERLYLENEDFQEMCQDHAEVCGLLDAWTAPPDVHLETILGYRTVLVELEVEIVEALQARFGRLELPQEDLYLGPKGGHAQKRS